MKIVSRFKDYYDHQAFLYGVDELQVYPRKEIHEGDFTFSHESKINIITDDMRHIWNAENVNVHFLVVAGRVFPITGNLYYREEGFSLFTVEHAAVKNEITRYRRSTHVPRAITALLYEQEVSPQVMQLCREVGHPVFILADYHYTRSTGVAKYQIDCRLPILGQVKGFPAIYPAEQIYQDLSAYFAPTELVIAPPSDLEKAQQHGFDKRISFRHRI